MSKYLFSILCLHLVICISASAEVTNIASSERNYQPGYRHLSFSYAGAEKKKVTRRLSIWYPTTDKVRIPIRYRHVSRGTTEPAAVAKGSFPLVLFSHGLWSSPEHSAFITEHLARAGYIVAGPHHSDAATEWKRQKPAMPEFFKPHEWDDRRHADRGEDIRALLKFLLTEHKKPNSFLYGRLREDRIGAMGYSMGGYTIGGLIGGWAAWRERRIRCALLLSPYIHPFMRKGGVERIQVPVMLQGALPGDIGITPFLPFFYGRLSHSKYLFVLNNENHFSWMNLVCKGKPFHEAVRGGSAELIVRYGLAFFEHHLKEDPAALRILKKKDAALNGYIFNWKNP